MKDMQCYLQQATQPNLMLHPLFLPTALLELINTFFIGYRREPERALYLLELQHGITRGKHRTDVWGWNYELHRESTKNCNSLYNNLVYLERRFEFVVGLCQFLLESLASIQEEGLPAGKDRQKVLRGSKAIKEIVLNSLNLAKMELHQTQCLQKRCQALITVVKKHRLSLFHKMLIYTVIYGHCSEGQQNQRQDS
jgi:hypothetical protein